MLPLPLHQVLIAAGVLLVLLVYAWIRLWLLRGQRRALDASLVRLEEKQGQVDLLQRQLADKEQDVSILQQNLENSRRQEATLLTRLEMEREQNSEKMALLEQAETHLTRQFKVVAQEIFDERGRRFKEINREELNQLLTPFRQQLDGFKQKVEDVYVNDVRERASLKQELEQLRSLNQQINEEARQLTQALKGDRKLQGNWGELVLERLLEQSGLRRGVEYEVQGSFRDTDSRLLRPDVIVHLPQGKDVVIDSKVSLTSYEQLCRQEQEERKQHYLKEHVRAVRNHVTSLSEKHYSALKGVNSLDFVLMFMPIEAAFVTALQHDDSLFNYAFERHIVMVTPTTLLATLRTIENIWRFERQNKNAQAIAERAGAVYDKLRGFVEEMEKLGTQLDTLGHTYTMAMNKLSQGRGNLISQASRFVDLGVKVKKNLPDSVMERAELEEL
ncbi:MAG: DNA recombination protein RmuC [Desulfuromonas sp.]|nr:MAG: DNA recombination protein RmuC [Desulfuromonas sp.]